MSSVIWGPQIQAGEADFERCGHLSNREDLMKNKHYHVSLWKKRCFRCATSAVTKAPPLTLARRKLLDCSGNFTWQELVLRSESIVSSNQTFTFFVTGCLQSLVSCDRTYEDIDFSKAVTLLNSRSSLGSFESQRVGGAPIGSVCACCRCVIDLQWIDEQTGGRTPALPEEEYVGRLQLINATWLFTVSFRRVVKPNGKQAGYDRLQRQG